MKRKNLELFAADWIETSPCNFVSEDEALNESIIGMRIYEEPLFAFGAADDDMFNKLKSPEAIGPHFILPKEWLPNAKTVISFFLPFTDCVVESNACDMKRPSPEWLNARFEGQTCLNQLTLSLKSKLEESGAKAVIPSMDERFWSSTEESEVDGIIHPAFSSVWSERHIGFVCGLGTLGLSKNLITERGTCGRFGSLVTDAVFPTDVRRYTKIYEYCTYCGLCVRNCPANAISIEDGKNHEKCWKFLMRVLEENRPRYGCGKCQVSVPCMRKIPKSSVSL
jgi:epoxyqueuosine reductase QueG